MPVAVERTSSHASAALLLHVTPPVRTANGPTSNSTSDFCTPGLLGVVTLVCTPCFVVVDETLTCATELDTPASVCTTALTMIRSSTKAVTRRHQPAQSRLVTISPREAGVGSG